MPTHTLANRQLFLLLSLAIVVSMGLSGQLLNLIYPYSTPGGSFIGKIHPGSYLLLGCAALLVMRQGLIRTVHAHFYGQLAILQFLVVVIFIAIFNVVRFGPNGAAYLADTFMAAPLAVLLASHLGSRERYKIAEIILILVFINSLLTIAELLLRQNLIPHDNEIGASYFRASGLFGHPLANGLMTAPLLPLLLITSWSSLKKAVVASVYILSILACGARGALVIGAPLFLGAITFGIAQNVWRGRLRGDVGLAVPWAAIIGAGVFTYLLIETSFGARFMERGLYDENAAVRVGVFNVLSYLSPDDLWHGIDTTSYEAILNKYPDIEIIENFWINLILSFGIPLFFLFCISFILFISCFSRLAAAEIIFATLSFMLIASTNNSLSTKSAALTTFSLAVYGLRGNSRFAFAEFRPHHRVRFPRIAGEVKNA
jgi:hypothetical protein